MWIQKLEFKPWFVKLCHGVGALCGPAFFEDLSADNG